MLGWLILMIQLGLALWATDNNGNILQLLNKNGLSVNINHKQLLVDLNDGINIYLTNQNQNILIQTQQNKIYIHGNITNNIYISTNLLLKAYKGCQQIQPTKQLKSNINNQLEYKYYSCSSLFSIGNIALTSSSIQVIKQTYKNKVQSYMKQHHIKLQHYQIVSYGIMQALSSIKWRDNKWLCFGDNECDWRLSPLAIGLIGDYDKDIGQQLCDSFLDYLEESFLYSNKQFSILPEHIEVVLKYYNKESVAYSRVGRVLNGMINNILLYSVNHIHHQINYRQKQKLHPTLSKMLTISFLSNSISEKASSIYIQSFMEDIYYNSPSEQLEMAIAKYMLLNKILVVSKVYNDHVYGVQASSILSIIKTLLSDQLSKKGIYKSIVNKKQGRFYTQDYTYQTLLPYAYGITKIYPKQPFDNLTTTLGLASLPSTSLAYDTYSYRYRGIIHAYFNFKILGERKQQSEKSLWKNIQSYILSSWKQQRQIYTAWDQQGTPKEQLPWLKIVSISFLSMYNIE